MRKLIAIQVAGTMSQTSKMPCKSFGLPTRICNVGGKLREVPGSACFGCYAAKGFYTLYKTVGDSQENRLAKLLSALEDADKAREWIDAIKALIGVDTLFRWHDSGDLLGGDLGYRHLSLIVQIAIEMPQVSFWLPTREAALVTAFFAKHDLPENLVVRLSAPMIDQAPTSSKFNTSTIHRHGDAHGFECTAPSRGGYCGDCRACFNRDVANVSYAYH